MRIHGQPLLFLLRSNSKLAWISNYIPSKLSVEITFPFPNFNGFTDECWSVISSHFLMPTLGVMHVDKGASLKQTDKWEYCMDSGLLTFIKIRQQRYRENENRNKYVSNRQICNEVVGHRTHLRVAPDHRYHQRIVHNCQYKYCYISDSQKYDHSSRLA